MLYQWYFLSTAIVSSPKSVNVSLATRKAMFSCKFRGHHIYWKQDGVSINFGPGQEFDVTTVTLNEAEHCRLSTLTVDIALSQNRSNNTRFTCAPFALPISFADSEPALLLIQGMSYFCQILYCLSTCVHIGVCVCCLGF